MEDAVARPLDSPKLVRAFLKNALQFPYDEKSDIESRIVKGETGISQFRHYRNYNTYDNDDYWCEEYNTEDARWGLRKRIVDELITLPRLSSDDEIDLGKGGAFPLSELKSQKKAFIITGLPASGKSGIANQIADSTGSLIIDSDYAKRKLPEYLSYEYGATLVHKESSRIVSGFTDKPMRYQDILSLSELAAVSNFNVVLPKIGHTLADLLTLAEAYKKIGYEVHLTLVNLDKRKATIRAIHRYIETERYVPIGLIFDGYGNDPILNYYQLKCHYENTFDSFGMISTNVKKGEKPTCIESTGDNPSRLFQKAEFHTTLLA